MAAAGRGPPLLRVNLGQTLIALPDKAKVEEGVRELKRSLDQDGDNAVAWRLLAEAMSSDVVMAPEAGPGGMCPRQARPPASMSAGA
ncbi:hypothetical protein [Mycobacterium tuberculosis]|uniref:hypothetical protein n=1 Tax=Mycobacterium tuberculosis TaxID=1773 RepID=UPI00272AE500|nr:hypothetical protein [Mycobacterium tuberculosis]